MNTSELRLATGIALALTRSPLETAFAALDLDHLSGGRFTLGLGTSVRWWHEDLFGVPYDRPVARLAEAVRIIRLVLSGQAKASGRFDGEFWQLDFSRLAMKPPVRPSLPVCEMAKSFVVCGTPGEVADRLEPLWAVADSMCLQPPPLPAAQRSAYEARIAELIANR